MGINPTGCTREGHSIDGVLPDDQRRAGDFTWPPPKENYVWEGLQGALVQAVILYRAGYDVWNREDQALLRAVQWLYDQADYPAEGDDTWQPHATTSITTRISRLLSSLTPGRIWGGRIGPMARNE